MCCVSGFVSCGQNLSYCILICLTFTHLRLLLVTVDIFNKYKLIQILGVTCIPLWMDWVYKHVLVLLNWVVAIPPL
jgi:hypothetical protein